MDEKNNISIDQDDIDSLKENTEDEKAKTNKYLANWQRAEADFNNYKKRTEQERSEIVKFANLTLILSILPVIDDFERALNTSAKLDQSSWIEGIKLISRKLRTNLESQGVTEVKAVGEKFDTAFHQAVSQGDGKEGIIIEELQRGYKLHDRLIRPALVVVGNGHQGHNKSNQINQGIKEE